MTLYITWFNFSLIQSQSHNWFICGPNIEFLSADILRLREFYKPRLYTYKYEHAIVETFKV